MRPSGNNCHFYTHGYSRHPLYAVLKNIKNRCYTKSNKAFHNYGGKGVRVCDSWLNDPKKFVEWALANGWRKELQIDKDIIPKRLGIPALLYSPEMCSIVTRAENNLAKKNSRIIEHNGKKQTLKEWSTELNVSYSALTGRLRRHNSFSKKTPIRKEIKGKLVPYNGKSQSLPQWAREIGIPYKVLYDRIHKRKMPLAKALSLPKNFRTDNITFNGKTQSLTLWADEIGVLQSTLRRRIYVLKMPIERALTMPLQINKRSKLYNK